VLVLASVPILHPVSVTVRGVRYKLAVVRVEGTQSGSTMASAHLMFPQGRSVRVRGPAELDAYRVGDWVFCYSWWDTRAMPQSPGW
jgi:hypothetical protein